MPSRICSQCALLKDNAAFPRHGKVCYQCDTAMKAPTKPKRRYARRLRYDTPAIQRPELLKRWCGGCKTHLSHDAFPMVPREGGHPKRSTRCLQCWEKRLATKPHKTSAMLISKEMYHAMLIQQRGLCAICERPANEAQGIQRRLAVDHDHATNVVRGLLCHHCNMGLGAFQDDSSRLRRAIQYLAKQQTRTPRTTAMRTQLLLLSEENAS